jgi:hypothetical protein
MNLTFHYYLMSLKIPIYLKILMNHLFHLIRLYLPLLVLRLPLVLLEDLSLQMFHLNLNFR